MPRLSIEISRYSWLHRAIALIHAREPVVAADCIELHIRSWEASRPGLSAALCDAVRRVLQAVIMRESRSQL